MGERRDPIEVYISSFHQTLFEEYDLEKCNCYEKNHLSDKDRKRRFVWALYLKDTITDLMPNLGAYLKSLKSCPKSVLDQLKELEQSSIYMQLNKGFVEKTLYDGYRMSDFLLDIQCDLFTWIASELLFRKPGEFTKEYMRLYLPFEHNKSTINGIPVLNRKWRDFTKNINYLTLRLKNLPMPPHMFYIFSQNIAGVNNKKKRIKPELRFLTDDTIYNCSEGINLDTFFRFEKNLISAEIKGARYSIMAENENPSELLELLVDSYIERAFGFFMVKFAAFGVIKCQQLAHSGWNSSDFIKRVNFIKSMDDMVFSKVSLLHRCFLCRTSSCIFSTGVSNSFKFIKYRLLENFSNQYIEKFNYDPRNALNDINSFKDLYSNLSSIYDKLFKKHLTNKKKASSVIKMTYGDPLQNGQTPLFENLSSQTQLSLNSFDELNLSELLSNKRYSEVKALIMNEIANIYCKSFDTKDLYPIVSQQVANIWRCPEVCPAHLLVSTQHGLPELPCNKNLHPRIGE